jgi:type II secretion system protein N
LQLSGTANGKITAAMDKLKLTTGHGQINIDNAVFELGPLNFWVEQISFLSVDLMITMPDPDTMKIEKCSMKGKQLDLESAGEIKIARLFENSQLNLKVSIHLYPMFFMEAAGSIPANVAKANSDGTKVELTIGGTIQNPKIKILQGKK